MNKPDRDLPPTGRAGIFMAFGVAIILATLGFVDILIFTNSGRSPVHPAVALFGCVGAVVLAFVASVAYAERLGG